MTSPTAQEAIGALGICYLAIALIACVILAAHYLSARRAQRQRRMRVVWAGPRIRGVDVPAAFRKGRS